MTEQRPAPRKPVPSPNIETQFYWDKVQEGELWLQRCQDCDKPYFYPRFFCPRCLGTNVEWFKASGRGRLHTYVINHRPPPAFEAEAPYALAVVELEEGVRMVSALRGLDPAGLELGLPVDVEFERVSDAIALPYFRPRGAASRDGPRPNGRR